MVVIELSETPHASQEEKEWEEASETSSAPPIGFLFGLVSIGFIALSLVIFSGSAPRTHSASSAYLKYFGLTYPSVDKWDIPIIVYFASLFLSTLIKSMLAILFSYDTTKETPFVALCNLVTHPLLWSVFFLATHAEVWGFVTWDRTIALQCFMIACQGLTAFWEWRLLDMTLPLQKNTNLLLAISGNVASYLADLLLRVLSV